MSGIKIRWFNCGLVLIWSGLNSGT